MPHLKKLCPQHSFQIKDSNEEWEELEKLKVIDVVVGINKVTVFNQLETFCAAPRLTTHDFDALANLRLMKKLGKIKQVRIIGVPSKLGEGKLSDLADSVSRLIDY